MRHHPLLLAALTVCWALSGAALAAEPRGKVSGTQCVECHTAETKMHVYHGNCLTCHVTAEEHSKAESPKMLHPGLPESKDCQSCHVRDDKHMNFAFSEHNRAGLQCRDCHGTHSPKVKSLNVAMEKGGKTTALCASCHQDVLSRYSMRSHHPVKEGAMSCTSCHDPHGGKLTRLESKTAQCTQCHQAVRGPHVFEHAPAVEDCTTCHDPHGTPNRKLLNLVEPSLCLQCHSVAGSRHGRDGTDSNGQIISATALRNCQSCHSQVHGSSQDQHLRY